MENNGTHNAQDIPQAQHNGDRPGDNVVSFPSNSDTQLRDISTLLQGAPVIQQAAPVSNGSETAASTKGSAVPSEGSAIATSEDFDKVEEKPFARKIGPKTIAGAGLALLILLPIAGVFRGGGSNSNSNQPDEVSAASSEEDGAYVSAEEYAAQQAELEQLRSQQAFIDQQVDAEAIDAAGRQRQQSTSSPQQAKPSTQTASRSTASTATASRPTRTTATTQPSSVTVRPAPVPPRAAASSSRPAPVTVASRAPAPSAQQPSPQLSAREPEPVDPFERRAQLQALGSYGAPPPGSKAVTAAQPASDEQANPFETQNPYIQAIAIEPQAQPAVFQKTDTRSPESISPAKRPITAEELQYEEDAAAVLLTEPPEVVEPGAVEEDSPVTAAPTAIMPGTSVKAELPHGFSWQEGAPLPEVVLSTTEDIMAGEQVALPAGTQFLGQAQIDPSSGAVSIQIVGMFGETDISIPRASVVVQAEDGSVLTASTSGGPSRSSGPNMGSFFMESLGNGLGNVIDGDDNLAVDIAGGMAETVIDNQVERSEANANARASRSSAQPVVWNLDARTVRVTFNNYIPLANAQL